MQLPVYDCEGTEVDRIELDESVFGVPMNEAVVHQALVRQRTNARVGTAKTKTRSEVSGSTRKLYRPKHTGRARAGDLRSPLRRHGGVIFGPRPRDYRQAMPKKMRRLALKCLLSDKLAEGEIRVIDKLELEDHKTSSIVKVLRALEIDRSALIALASPDSNIVRATANVEGISTIQARQLNVVDLLKHKTLIITRDAVQVAESLWGTGQPAEVTE